MSQYSPFSVSNALFDNPGLLTRPCDPKQYSNSCNNEVGPDSTGGTFHENGDHPLEVYALPTSLPPPPRLRPMFPVPKHQLFTLPQQGAVVLPVSETLIGRLPVITEEQGISSSEFCRTYNPQRDSWCQLG